MNNLSNDGATRLKQIKALYPVLWEKFMEWLKTQKSPKGRKGIKCLFLKNCKTIPLVRRHHVCFRLKGGYRSLPRYFFIFNRDIENNPRYWFDIADSWDKYLQNIREENWEWFQSTIQEEEEE